MCDCCCDCCEEDTKENIRGRVKVWGLEFGIRPDTRTQFEKVADELLKHAFKERLHEQPMFSRLSTRDK